MAALIACACLPGALPARRNKGEAAGTTDVEALVDCVDDARGSEAPVPASAPEGLQDALEQAVEAHSGGLCRYMRIG